MGSIFNKVVRPDVVGVLRPKTDAGSVIEPKTSTFGVFGRYFKPLTPPDPGYPLSVHPPARVSQHRCNPAIAIATVLDSQSRDISGQRRLIIGSDWLLALRGAMLAKNSASKPLRDAMPGNHVLHTGTATCGA